MRALDDRSAQAQPRQIWLLHSSLHACSLTCNVPEPGVELLATTAGVQEQRNKSVTGADPDLPHGCQGPLGVVCEPVDIKDNLLLARLPVAAHPAHQGACSSLASPVLIWAALHPGGILRHWLRNLLACFAMMPCRPAPGWSLAMLKPLQVRSVIAAVCCGHAACKNSCQVWTSCSCVYESISASSCSQRRCKGWRHCCA